MDYDDFQQSIKNLVEAITNLPDGIASVLSSPGVTPKSAAGTIAGGASGSIFSTINKLNPKMDVFGDKLKELADTISSISKMGKAAKLTSSTSPMGMAGLEELEKISTNRFIPSSIRKRLVSQIEKAKDKEEKHQNLRKEAKDKFSDFRSAHENHRKAVRDHLEALKQKNRVDNNARRANLARDAARRARARANASYAAGTGSKASVDLARQRFNRADKFARQMFSRSRQAGKRARAAGAARTAAATAARTAAGTARAAKSAATGAAARSGAAAARAGATAASATSTASLVAVGAAAVGVINAFVALTKWTQALGKEFARDAEIVNASNRHLAAFSGRLGAAFNRLDVGGIRRTMAMATGTDHTASRLVDSINRLRDAQLQGNISYQNLSNSIANMKAEFSIPIEAAKSDMWREIERMANGMGLGEGGFSGIAGEIASIPTQITTAIIKGFNDLAGIEALPNQMFHANGGGPADDFVEAMSKAHAKEVGGLRGKLRQGLGDRWK